jgi:hypothetical protein
LYLQFYQSYTTTLADGTKKRSIDKGDDVALRMRALDLDGVYEYAAEVTGASLGHLRDRFAHLNPGMQRMSLGNMVRKHFKEEMETA